MAFTSINELADPSCDLCKGTGHVRNGNMIESCACIKRNELTAVVKTEKPKPDELSGLLSSLANPRCAYCLGSGERNNGYFSYPCNCVHRFDHNSITIPSIPIEKGIDSSKTTKTIHISATSPSIAIEEDDSVPSKPADPSCEACKGSGSVQVGKHQKLCHCRIDFTNQEEKPMPEKIQVPQKVIEAILYLRTHRAATNDNLLDFTLFENDKANLTTEGKVIRDYIKQIGRDTYARVIVTDHWEVEPTAIEKLQQHVDDVVYGEAGHEYRMGALHMIKQAMKILSKDYPELKDVIKNV